MPTGLASVAAAVTAGYVEVVTDRGAAWNAATRYEVVLEKRVTGDAGFTQATPLRAYGQGSSQANAEAQALAGLNKQRDHRYGTASGGKGPYSGSALTDDAN